MRLIEWYTSRRGQRNEFGKAYIAYQCTVAYLMGILSQLHENFSTKRHPSKRKVLAIKEMDMLFYVSTSFNEGAIVPDFIDYQVFPRTRSRSKTKRPIKKFLRRGGRRTGSALGQSQYVHLKAHAVQCAVVFEKSLQTYRNRTGKASIHPSAMLDIARKVISDYSFKSGRSTARNIGIHLKVLGGSSTMDAYDRLMRILSLIAASLLTYYPEQHPTGPQYEVLQSDGVVNNLSAFIYKAQIKASQGDPRIHTPGKPTAVAVDQRTDEFEDSPPTPPRDEASITWIRGGGRRRRSRSRKSGPLSSHETSAATTGRTSTTAEEQKLIGKVVSFMKKEGMIHHGDSVKYVTVLIPERSKLVHPAHKQLIDKSLHSLVLEQCDGANMDEECWKGCKTSAGKRGLDYLFVKTNSKLYPLDSEDARAVKKNVGKTISVRPYDALTPQVRVKRFRHEIPVSAPFSVASTGLIADFPANMVVSLRRILRDK